MNELALDSHAKINLSLQITGKFPDGYHQLETIFQRISLKDSITLKEVKKGIRVTSNSKEMPLDESNLAFRASDKIIKRSGIDKGVVIHIEKKIPMGAGLGGGSSNAATVLNGLNRMWDLGMKKEELSSMARELGADVSFFLFDNCAFGFGRGDILKPIKTLCELWVVLVHPEIFISTAWVYKNFREKLTKNRDYISILTISLQENKKEDVSKNLVNDLESVVFPVYPQIENLKRELLNEGAEGALMSGSGSTVFGLFHDRSSAEEVLGKLADKKKTTYLARFVS